MSNKCGHKSKKAVEKKKIAEEELPCAYAATVTTTACEIVYEYKTVGKDESKREKRRSLTETPRSASKIRQKKCYG
jgi:hypothetical protein